MPWRRKWQPTAVFLPGKFHGQRACPWGHTERDTTEHKYKRGKQEENFYDLGFNTKSIHYTKDEVDITKSKSVCSSEYENKNENEKTNYMMGKVSAIYIFIRDFQQVFRKNVYNSVIRWQSTQLKNRWKVWNINNLRYADNNHPYGRKQIGTKEPLNEGEKGEWKSWLKAQHSKNKDCGIGSHHFMANRWGNNGKVKDFIFWGLQNYCRWWL